MQIRTTSKTPTATSPTTTPSCGTTWLRSAERNPHGEAVTTGRRRRQSSASTSETASATLTTHHTQKNAQAPRIAGADSYDGYDETIYGLEGVLTWTIAGTPTRGGRLGFAGTSEPGCCPGGEGDSLLSCRDRGSTPWSCLSVVCVWRLSSGRPIAHVAADLGIHSETLRKYVRRAEADAGLRPDLPTSEEREAIKRLRQENFELRPRERDLEVARRCFLPRSSTQTDRGEPLRRRASWPLRASSRSAPPWACRCPRTTSARAASGRCVWSRMSGCSLGSGSCIAAIYYAYGYRRIGGRRCAAPASRRHDAAYSG